MIREKIASTTHLIKTLTGTGGIPSAEVEDAACLRGGCHETRLLDGEVLFKGKYRFDHKPHLTGLRRGKKLRCTSCHSQMVQGSHISVTESVCFTCHFKGQGDGRVLHPVAGCTSCHSPPTETIRTTLGIDFDHKPFLERKVACWKCHFDTVQGAGEVPRQVCQTCHGDDEKLVKFEDPEFLHDWHVTKRKVECFQCHSEIRHGLHPKPGQQDSSCTTCHFGGHGAHANMFAGRGGKDIKVSPSKHFQANLDCVACHETPDAKHDESVVDAVTWKVTEKACLSCHGSSRKGALAEWKSTLAEMLSDARDELAKARKAYANMAKGDPRKADVNTLLETGRHNCDFVEKASGVHNLQYAMDLLEKASDSANEALRIAEESIKKAKDER